MFHITHSLIIGKSSAAEQFQKFKFVIQNMFPVLHLLFIYIIQGHTEVVFVANIGNFNSRRRIFRLRFMYFVFWHFCISTIFCFYFCILGIFLLIFWISPHNAASSIFSQGFERLRLSEPLVNMYKIQILPFRVMIDF